jgi:hypothetical protein
MIDSKLHEQIASLQKIVEGMAPIVAGATELARQAEQLAREVEAISAHCAPFDRFFLENQTWNYFQRFIDEQAQLLGALHAHHDAQNLVSTELPKRGWYLSGEEPCTVTFELARFIRDGDLEQVDQVMMQHLPDFQLDALREWLAQEGMPNYCADRLVRFVRHHQEGNYEEATYIGVPLIDEIAKHLYRGKAFTTKRGSRRGGDQSKPELAFKTVSGPELANYCEAFIQAFGSLQEDPDPKRLADENYWNRHAIVHGLMQRAMGVKDSAKCLMAIKFLIFGRKEEEKGVDANDEQPSNAVGSTST